MNVSDQLLAIRVPRCRTAIVTVVMMVGSLPVLQAREVPAFPGAQGWGATTPGGRNGRVLFVTSQADSGPGTFGTFAPP